MIGPTNNIDLHVKFWLAEKETVYSKTSMFFVPFCSQHTETIKFKSPKNTQKQRDTENRAKAERWRNLEVQRRKGFEDLQLLPKTAQEIPTPIPHQGFLLFLSFSLWSRVSCIHICLCIYVYAIWIWKEKWKWVFFIFFYCGISNVNENAFWDFVKWILLCIHMYI